MKLMINGKHAIADIVQDQIHDFGRNHIQSLVLAHHLSNIKKYCAKFLPLVNQHRSITNAVIEIKLGNLTNGFNPNTP